MWDEITYPYLTLSFLHIDMTMVAESCPRVRQVLAYST